MVKRSKCMIPNIRFKGFNGEWEKKKLGEVAPLKGGYAFNSVNFKDSGIPIVRISNILESEEVGGEFVFYDKIKNEKQFLLRYEDIVIAMSGATTGKIALVKTKNKLYQNQRVGKFSRTSNVDYKYLSAIVSSSNFSSELNKLLSSSAQPNASSSGIDSIKLYFPSCKQEQSLLGSFWERINNIIVTTNLKLASLKQIKAASLQSMFPQEGETVPKVRFKGFEREWESKSFSALYKKSIIKNDLTFGTDKIISVANMYYLTNVNVSDLEYLKTYNIMKLGDIAFEGNKSKRFLHGRFVENTIGDGIVSHVFVVFHPISAEHDINYWKYAINNENIMRNVLIRCTKSSTMMTDLVVDDFLKETILVPTYAEQQKIGTYFRNLDRQISLQTQRLEKLKQIKTACLDKMFV